MRDLTLITYNLWHGLSGEGTLRFGELEPTAHRLEREQAQEQYFEGVKADIVFLQETNPLDVRMARFAKIFNAVADGQIDSSGVKLESAGLPLNLYSGLTTYALAEFQPIHRKSLKLSGSSIQNEWFSIQFKEARYALLTECIHPAIGRILLVNVHLHHGLERTKSLMVRVLDWRKRFAGGSGDSSGVISSKSLRIVETKLAAGDRRRQEEVERLLEYLDGLRNRYHMIIMAGDFNASPESDVHSKIKAAGFEDLWLKKHGKTGSSSAGKTGRQASVTESPANKNDVSQGYTFNSETNLNHRFNAKFKLPENWDALKLSGAAHDELRKIIMEHESRPRRIDYLYVKSTSPVSVQSIEMLGPHEGAETVAAHARVELSDHFGLRAVIRVPGMMGK